ncbi:hypothetical protein [Micromonospora zhanjiangensis]|uniref:Uncharacterized protein n=1 Tax=Micromonospora zhanjiangensis TaxID=1522057 RepID=A0ABV8KI70_9ACTN
MTRSAAAAAVTAGGAAVGRALAGRGLGSWPVSRPTDRDGHWQVVTVGRSPAELAPGGRLPEPLARLGDAVEVRLRPAPGDRGTEIAVRLRDGEPRALTGLAIQVTGDDPRLAIRTALRLTKQWAETGEVLY